MILQTKDLTKVYGRKENEVIALKPSSIMINEGDFIAIVGPSGGGKSTLLHLISGLDHPSGGKVFYKENDIYALSDKELSKFRRQNIGFVFQSFNLLPVLTVQENIIMPLLIDGQKPNEDYFNEIVTLLGIENRLTHLPNELSGGQKQRTAIARALITNPYILFADEPTGNLDAKSSNEVISLLQKINKNLHKTIILVTHDMQIANKASRKLYIEDGIISEEVAE